MLVRKPFYPEAIDAAPVVKTKVSLRSVPYPVVGVKAAETEASATGERKVESTVGTEARVVAGDKVATYYDPVPVDSYLVPAFPRTISYPPRADTGAY